jgi:glutaredoxin 3
MITIITKWYCPFCHAAVRILDKIWVEYKNIDITLKAELYKEVQNITDCHTVPQVFIWDIHWKFLGWYTELNELYKNGELEKLLK